MNMNDIELKLLAGIPIEVDRLGEIHIPTVREIIKIDESKYSQYLSSVLINKESLDEKLDDNTSDFDVLFALCFHHEDFKEIVFNSFEIFLKEKPLMNGDGDNMFFEFKDGKRLDKNNHLYFKNIIKMSHFIKETTEEELYKPANSKAKEMIETMLRYKKNKPKPKEEMNLHSIISGLSWRPNGINVINIFDLTIYQIYNGFFTTENIDNYNHTLTAIYTGNMDSKEIKMSKVHWAKKH